MEPLCVVCQTTLYEGCAFRGMGDGTGQRFAHEECYWKNSAEASEAKLARVRVWADVLNMPWILREVLPILNDDGEGK